MKMNNLIALILVLTGSIVSAFGQKGGDIPFEKEYFKENKAEFKEAKKWLQDGLALINVPEGYYPNYQGAIPLLKRRTTLTLKVLIYALKLVFVKSIVHINLMRFIFFRRHMN